MADTERTLPAVRAQISPAPVVTLEEKRELARYFAESGLFGAKSEAEAMALILIGEAEGMHPAIAIQEYDILEGKPARKSERIQARFQMSGGKITWEELSRTCARATFTHPQGSDCTIQWTIEDVSNITYAQRDRRNRDAPPQWKKLSEKLNWRNYPRAMLRARVISEGCRTCFPGYALITLASEEAEDFGTLDSEAVRDDETAAQEQLAPPPPASDPAGLPPAQQRRANESAVIENLRTAKTEAELDEMIRRDRPSLSGWTREHFDDTAASLRETLRTAAHAAEHDITLNPPPPGSPFHKLWDTGMEITSDDLFPADRADAYKVWLGSITQDALKAMTPPEVERLRQLKTNLKLFIDGAMTADQVAIAEIVSN